MIYDYLVIAGYFALMVAISIIFKKVASNSTSDYFRGGGKMLWWMVGATAFMTQFSAATFTGFAGTAFKNGFSVIAVFVGNMFAYICAYLYFAKRFRNMRVDTPTQGVRNRFGSINEQFFTYMIIPLSILNAGVWLNGLGVFVSGVFDYDITATIFITGAIVLFISLLSGAWGVVASDFIQTLVVAVISIATAVVALFVVGGFGEIVDKFPTSFIKGPDISHTSILVCTFLFFLVKQLQSINNMQESYRFLNAKDSKNASKAALFALVLMFFGIIVWFIPPWVSAIMYQSEVLSFTDKLAAKASDTAYLVFVREQMPLGTMGLLVSGLFAATMSSMDSSLNRNSGVFVKSFYLPILNKGKTISDEKQLKVGQIACIINGVLVILMAQFYASLRHLSIFDLLMQVSTLVQSPILVPLFLGMLIKKTPKWAPYATVIFGLFVSYLVKYHFNANFFNGLFDANFSKREIADLNNVIIPVAAHLFLTAGFFCLSTLFYKEDDCKMDTDKFFAQIEDDVIAGEGQDLADRMQRDKLGTLTMYMAAGLLLMCLIPNPLWGRVLFFICSLLIFAIGFALKKTSGFAERAKLIKYATSDEYQITTTVDKNI
jgi:SSS family transporter